MKPTCRLLLIEDDDAEAQSIERRCCPEQGSAAIDVVADVKAAEDALTRHEYDLVICDLALPADERKFDPEVNEGLRLFQLIRERTAGTPVIILSGNLNMQIVQGFLKDSRSYDIYGLTEEPLVRAFAKEELPNCIDAVQTHIARIKTLDTLEIDGVMNLSLSDARAVRIYGRRIGAARATVEPLAGGLSDSKTLKVTYRDADGDVTGRVVVKLGPLERVLKEADRYQSVEARMPVGLGAHVLDVVRAGAGRRGALIYQLADEYTESLFGLIQARSSLAVIAVERLAERMKLWVTDAPVVVRTLAHVRRCLITDDEVSEAGRELPADREIELPVRETRAHGDLHGLNVLVNAKGEPALIDYGEVMRDANAALDPVTLELSIVYHPEMIGNLNGWPSREQAESWLDLDTYCAGCPVEDFVRACRSWAVEVSAGEEELLASAYAYSIRQMKYSNSARELAEAVTAGCFAALTSA